ncbi:hypothetical protein PQX77_007652 [Marasmius sp. AFHP31]|nr:hypothetical protein PQX77_007652 [Marasmius sp. AFHP31]
MHQPLVLPLSSPQVPPVPLPSPPLPLASLAPSNSCSPAIQADSPLLPISFGSTTFPQSTTTPLTLPLRADSEPGPLLPTILPTEPVQSLLTTSGSPSMTLGASESTQRKRSSPFDSDSDSDFDSNPDVQRKRSRGCGPYDPESLQCEADAYGLTRPSRNGPKVYTQDVEEWYCSQAIASEPTIALNSTCDQWLRTQVIGSEPVQLQQEKTAQGLPPKRPKHPGGGSQSACPRNSKKLARGRGSQETGRPYVEQMAEDGLDEGGGEGDGDEGAGEKDKNDAAFEESQRWIVDFAKKRNINLKAGETWQVLFEALDTCKTELKPQSLSEMAEALRDIAGTLRQTNTPSPGTGSQLAALVSRVRKGETAEQALGFFNILALCDLRVRVENLMMTGLNKKEVYEIYAASTKAENRAAYKTFMKWIGQGTVFSELAQAGSIYLLFVIAAAKGKRRFGSLISRDIAVLCHAFLRPNECGSLGEVVKQVFIPALCTVRRAIPIAVMSSLCPALRNRLSLHDAVIDCNNLCQSDLYFAPQKHNTWAPAERDWDVWSVFQPDHGENDVPLPLPQNALISDGFSLRPLFPIHSELPLSQMLTAHNEPAATEAATETADQVIVINTNFNGSDTRNKKLPCGRSLEARKAWTGARRKHIAERCFRPSTMEEFAEKVTGNLKYGFRKDTDAYVYYDRKVLGDHLIDIRDKDGVAIALLGGALSDDLTDGMLDAIQCLFPELQETDSAADPNVKYDCSHLCIWNRFSTEGKGAPTDADPHKLRKEDTTRPADVDQFLPRFSCEMYDQEKRSQRLMDAMESIVEHLSTKLKERFPDEYSKLESFTNALPHHNVSPSHPFAGVTMNLNVATIAHMDPMDWLLCLVLALHDCTGGELVLDELGIVTRFYPGDFAIFSSMGITHYNLDFKGRRVSFAFSTDVAAKKWVEDNNGWRGNAYMRA